MAELFTDHIASGILALCGELKSYNILAKTAGCTVKDCNTSAEEEKRWYTIKRWSYGSFSQ